MGSAPSSHTPKVIINLITTMKVTRQLYNEIKARLLEAPGYTQKEVAKMVKVSQPTVSYVANSKNYKWYHQALREKFAVQSQHNKIAKRAKELEERGLGMMQAFEPDKLKEQTEGIKRAFGAHDWVEQDIKRIKTNIRGHLREIYSLLKQI